MDQVKIGGAVIEYLVHENEEPVLFIPPSLPIDGLGLPLLAQSDLASNCQLINDHRRDYMGSIARGRVRSSLCAGSAGRLFP